MTYICLTHGETWFYRHNFYPYNEQTKKFNDSIFEKMFFNEQIINNTKIYQIKNLQKYIKKYNNDKFNEIINKINIIKNKNIKDLFKLLEKEYRYLYSKIYKKIMKELKIESFYGITYYTTV